MNTLDIIFFCTIMVVAGVIFVPISYQIGCWIEDQWKEMFEDIKRSNRRKKNE